MKSQNTFVLTVVWYNDQRNWPFDQNAAVMLKDPLIFWLTIGEVSPFGNQLYQDLISLLKLGLIDIDY